MNNLHKLPARLAAAAVLTAAALWLPLQAQNGASSDDPAAEGNSAAPEASETSERDSTAAGAAESHKLLRRVRETLNGYRSIQAKLIERVQIGERSFRAEGTYLQGSNLKSRLEFDVRLSDVAGGLEASLLQVCDGQVLWTQRTIGEESRITRRDVRQILQTAQSGGNYPENVLAAALGLGGLPAMLASIEQVMGFRPIDRQTIGDETYLLVEGTWRQGMLSRWGVRRSEDGSFPRLPVHVPDRVRIYIQEETLFPRRIQFVKRPPEKNYYRPMVTLDLLEVVLNAPVSEDKFYFVPPDDVMQQDVTNVYVQMFQPGQPPGETGQSEQPPTPPGPSGLPSVPGGPSGQGPTFAPSQGSNLPSSSGGN